MQMNTLILAAALALSACAAQKPSPVTQKAMDDISMEKIVPVGSIDVIDLEFTPAYNTLVGNKAILEVMQGSHPRQLRAIPLKKGATTIIIRDEAGIDRRRIHYKVVTNELFTKYEAVRYLLRTVKGVMVEIVDNRIVIDGKVDNDRDREKVLSVQAAYYDNVLNLAANSEKLCETRRCESYQELYGIEPQTGSLYDEPFPPAREPASSGSWGVADPILEAVRKATNQINELQKRFPPPKK